MVCTFEWSHHHKLTRHYVGRIRGKMDKIEVMFVVLSGLLTVIGYCKWIDKGNQKQDDFKRSRLERSRRLKRPRQNSFRLALYILWRWYNNEVTFKRLRYWLLGSCLFSALDCILCILWTTDWLTDYYETTFGFYGMKRFGQNNWDF